MDSSSIGRYISSLIKHYQKNHYHPNVESLNFLEQFASEEYLSSYKICSKLKSTDLEMAYKNVNKRVHTLESSGLIQEIYVDKATNKHNAKNYRLTEFGIYQLFLNRFEALLINQTNAIKSQGLSPNSVFFFRNYNDSILFESFVYPYFEKNTLFVVGNYLLWNLYQYLNNCCHWIETELRRSDIRVDERIFSWNEIPGKDNQMLLLHLKEIFNLESIDSPDIKKQRTKNNTITVKSQSSSIIIKLDEDSKKAIIMSTADKNQYKEFKYDVYQIGTEIWVVKQKPYEESVKDIVNNSKKQIGQLIYQFVYDLALAESNSKLSKEFSYYAKILSEDRKFMAAVKEIHKDRHKGFEHGYEMLRNHDLK